MAPSAPEITPEDLESCRASGVFSPVLFEWYKFTGMLCNFFACIRADSPAVAAPSVRDYAVLIGLLNQMSRLMLANVVLPHQGLHGDTTAILDRCIFESAVKVFWLCTSRESDRFDRLVADGLKSELELKAQIEAKVLARCQPLLIESRMRDSIDGYLKIAELSEAQVSATPKLPDLASLLEAIGSERLLYVVGQKIGFHHVHGTRPSLILHYLEDVDGVLAPGDRDYPTHVNQHVFEPLVVLDALRAFVNHVIGEPKEREELHLLLDATAGEISMISSEVMGRDFERVEIT